MQLVKGKKIIMKRDSSQVAVQLSLQNQNHSKHSRRIDSDFYHTRETCHAVFIFENFEYDFWTGAGIFFFFYGETRFGN